MRIIIFILLLAAATLIAGLYGALYDQITYSISNEFYTKMRFPQFGIEVGEINERWEVAKIGFYNTWSIGLGFGFFLSLTGLLHTENRKMVITTVKSFFISMLVGMIFAVIAYFFSEPPMDMALGIDLVDKESFYKVTSMNNCSYVGGTIGMFIGLAYQVIQTRLKKDS